LFSVGAAGTLPLFYQWYFNSNAMSSADNGTVTNVTLAIPNAQGSNAGFYFVVITNSFGAATSAVASLTLTNSDGTVFLPGNTNTGGTTISNSSPFMTQQPPASQSVGTNTTVSFVALADGAQPLFYQWRYNSNIIDSATNSTATNSTLTLTNVGPAGTNFVDVFVMNTFGAVTSTVAQLVVTNGSSGGPLPFPVLGSGKSLGEIYVGPVSVTGDGVVIGVRGVIGDRKIVLEYKDALSDAEWKPLTTNDSGALRLVDPAAPLDRSRYYRVRAE
jgi:hypothetical protein